MAKSGLNGATKWIIFLAGALITVGVSLQMIRSNTARIDKVEPKVQNISETVARLEGNIEYIKKGIDDLRDIKNSQ